MAKPLTYWTPKAGEGYVVLQGGLFFQDNLGNTIVTNLSENLIPNPTYVIGKYATIWGVV